MTSQTAARLCFLTAGVCLAGMAAVLRWVIRGAAEAMVNDFGGYA